VPGARVHVRAPRRLEEPGEVLLVPGPVLRALEHQVLEQVGESASAGRLVRGSYVVPEVHPHGGQSVVRGEDDGEPVGKGVGLELDQRRGGGEQHAREEGGHGCPGRTASWPSPLHHSPRMGDRWLRLAAACYGRLAWPPGYGPGLFTIPGSG